MSSQPTYIQFSFSRRILSVDLSISSDIVIYNLHGMRSECSIMADEMRSVRFDKNPFTNDMIVPVGKKQVKLSRMGKDSDVLMNQETGELKGTHIATYKKVDTEQFVKLFTQNIALTFGLKAAGIKAFSVLAWVVQHGAISKDIVAIGSYELESFLKAHDQINPPIKLSIPTLMRGLNELEKSQIIAKHTKRGWYFLNPNFLFNGDRIAFTTVIEREEAPTNED